MFGFAVGLFCLWGLFRVVGGGRHRSWGFGGCHHDRGDGGSRRGRRGGFGMLRRLFERLDTTPGQEKVIRNAVDEVTGAGAALKDDLHGARQDVGKAFRQEDFNAEVMAELLTRHDDAIDELRRATVGSLAKIHDTLDPEQRQLLADWLSRRSPWHGPYRSYA
jgi:Spy/CpxP family protein refolding chaperone